MLHRWDHTHTGILAGFEITRSRLNLNKINHVIINMHIYYGGQRVQFVSFNPGGGGGGTPIWNRREFNLEPEANTLRGEG